jgi:hypothetical protein
MHEPRHARPRSRTAARVVTATVLAAGFTLGAVAPAFADSPPPTNGGNGAGQSGQCTGQPTNRPEVCPAT